MLQSGWSEIADLLVHALPVRYEHNYHLRTQ